MWLIILFYAIGLAIAWYLLHPRVIRGYQGYAVINKRAGIVEKVYDGASEARNWRDYLTNVFALKMLQNEPHFPTLFGTDPEKKKVVTNYCGEVLNSSNLPKNWRKQISEIGKTAEKYDIEYIDNGRGNFTVKDGVIYWVDLGNVILRKICTHPDLDCEPFKGKTLEKRFKERYT